MPLQEEVKKLILDVPNFPKSGIIFKDIAPLLANTNVLQDVINFFAEYAKSCGAEYIIGIESRGFLFGVPLALKLALPFIPARKKGKLPGEISSATYALEYGTDSIEIQKSSLHSNKRYFIIDDVIATGGTAQAVSQILLTEGCKVAGFAFLIELSFLSGRKQLLKKTPEANFISLVKS